MRPAAFIVLAALGFASCAETADQAVAPSVTVAPSESRETTAAPTTTAPATTTAAALESTTTVTTTTSTRPPALVHPGSPMLEFSVAVGEAVELSRDELAAFVVDTLGDGRSWIARGAGFRLVDQGGLFTFIVAEPARVDELCAPLQTNGRFSCARNGWVAINSERWFGATDDWPADLETYRRYLVNHEIGHYIVGPGHDSCPGAGQPAPIMMQQSKSLDGCVPNEWVEPGIDGAAE